MGKSVLSSRTISLGFVIARFSFWLREIAISTGKDISIPRTGLSLPMGLGMVAFGALMTLLAAFRYRAIHRAIENDLPHPQPTLIFVTTGTVILLAVILIVYLLVASQQF
jgi:putative membrane protein